MTHPILKKSIQNIRLEQIKEKVNLESTIAWARNEIHLPFTPQERAKYMIKWGEDFMKGRKHYKFN